MKKDFYIYCKLLLLLLLLLTVIVVEITIINLKQTNK